MQGDPVTILVLDNDETCRELILCVLYDAGYAVEAFADLVAALNRIVVGPPDVLVLDYAMPVLSGRDVLQTLRQNGLAQQPVIILSASTHAVDCLSGGASYWIEKPFIPSHLISTISHCLQSSHP